MHEASIAEDLIETIERVASENGARRVISAQLRVGALTCIEPHALNFAFENMTRGRLAQGCQLIIERVPLVARCRECGWEGESSSQFEGCPRCEALGLEILSGREFQLTSIDVDDEAEEQDHA